MKIKHKRFTTTKIFPLILNWKFTASYILASGNVFRHTAKDSCIVHNESDLWIVKADVEAEDEFLHWDVDWTEIERQLDES